MKVLVNKEIKSILCSLTGGIFSISFLLIMGIMLWCVPGSLNIMDRGYAEMKPFFDLAPILFAVLIPILTMRLFSEEQRAGTLDLLLLRPIKPASIYWSKFIAALFCVILTLLPTSVYVISLSILASGDQVIDLGVYASAYLSLSLVASIFIAVGLLISSRTKNYVVAMVLSIMANLFLYYGFDLVTSVFEYSAVSRFVSLLSLSNHYQQMYKGIIAPNNIFVLIGYLALTSYLTMQTLSRSKNRFVLLLPLGIAVLYLCMYTIAPPAKYDLTSDKRYTLSRYSQELVAKVSNNEQMSVNIYLDGNLNADFQYLKESTSDMLTSLNSYARKKIEVKFNNPYKNGIDRASVVSYMDSLRMPAMIVNEVDREGKVSQQAVFPYAELTTDDASYIIPLLHTTQGATSAQNIALSVEKLEYAIVSAIRTLQQSESKNIAFIEGHGEFDQIQVFDAETILSNSYAIHRGGLMDNEDAIMAMDALVVAGPSLPFNTEEKYILDQYIMAGGRVLWLVDGAKFYEKDLEEKGMTGAVKNELNLDDLLFAYGVRIEGNIVQDMQCATTVVSSGNDVQSSVALPFPYSPLLSTNPSHIITSKLKEVKASFASSLSLVDTNNMNIQRSVLLATSGSTALEQVPYMLNLEDATNYDQSKYTYNNLAIAVALEGTFTSVFEHRPAPPTSALIKKNKGGSKMIIVSNSDIIRNTVILNDNTYQALPMGYDRLTNQLYGNRDFIENALNWLTNDDDYLQIMNKTQRIVSLNRKAIIDSRPCYSIFNTVFPVAFVLLIIGAVILYRRNKYGK